MSISLIGGWLVQLKRLLSWRPRKAAFPESITWLNAATQQKFEVRIGLNRSCLRSVRFKTNCAGKSFKGDLVKSGTLTPTFCVDNIEMKIEHVAVWSKNIEKLKAFYEKYFNAQSNDKYTNPSKGFSSFFLSFESGARLEIMQQDTVPDSTNDPYDQFTGFIHLAFSAGSEDKVDLLTEQLKADGFEILDGPRKTGDGYYESVVLDPENNRIEITT